MGLPLNSKLAILDVKCIRLEMRKREKHRIEEILVSSSSLVSGLSEASGVKSSWVEVSQESLKKSKEEIRKNRPIEKVEKVEKV